MQMIHMKCQVLFSLKDNEIKLELDICYNFA